MLASVRVYSALFALVRIASSLSCYSCKFDFAAKDNDDDDNFGWCANETLVQKDPGEVIRQCAAWEMYCMTAVKTTLGSFKSVSRSCVTRCSTQCESATYGLDEVTCAECCQSDNCNDDFSVYWYADLMKRQYSPWTRPVANEVDFNRRNNLRFPY